MAFYQDELVIIVHPKHPLLKVKDLKELEHYDYYSREKEVLFMNLFIVIL